MDPFQLATSPFGHLHVAGHQYNRLGLVKPGDQVQAPD